MTDQAHLPAGVPLQAQALDPRWLPLIDQVARAALGPRDRLGDALADEVRGLSQLYTRGRSELPKQSQALAARLRFFLPRDLPKIEGPLAELSRAGVLPPGPRWRVLDLGAGLGTTTLGVAGYAHRAGVEGLEVFAAERDPRSLEIMTALCAGSGQGALAEVSAPISLQTLAGDIEAIDFSAKAPFDLVVVGLALNELAGGKLKRRLALVKRWLRLLAPGGALLIVEPALREVSRDLQRLRDALVEREDGPVVVAPCTHRAPCPLLARDRDWCHGELPFALPDPLRETAKAAGLRWERLTAAWLALRAEPLPEAAQLPEGALRVVGGPVVTKGRCDWTLCGAVGEVRLGRLDRFKGPGDVLEGAARGSLLTVDAELEDGVRLRADKVGVVRVG